MSSIDPIRLQFSMRIKTRNLFIFAGEETMKFKYIIVVYSFPDAVTYKADSYVKLIGFKD